MILPMYTSPDARFSFHLQAILRPQLFGWFYTHFIDFCMSNEGQIFYYDDQTDESYRKFFCSRIVNNYREILADSEYCSLMKSRLDKGYYHFVWVDKFYVPGSDEYEKYHFVHPVMLYGYEGEDFVILNFSGERGNIHCRVPQKALMEGIANVFPENPDAPYTFVTETVTCFRLSELVQIPYSITELTDQLRAYLGIPYPDRVVSMSHAFGHVHGISCYDYILSRLKEGKKITFKALYDLEYHKEHLIGCFEYLRKYYEISEQSGEAVEGLKKVLGLLERSRLLCMKHNMRDGHYIASFSDNSDFINTFVQSITEAKRTEYISLITLYNDLVGRNLRRLGHNPEFPIPEDTYTVEKNGGTLTARFDTPEYICSADIISGSGSTGSFAGTITVNGDIIIPVLPDIHTVAPGVMRVHICRDVSVLSYAHPGDRDISFRLYAPDAGRKWDFRERVMPDWRWNILFRNLSMENGLVCDTFGNDPALVCDRVCVDADKAGILRISMKTEGEAEVGQVFFTTSEDRTTDAAKSISFALAPYDGIVEYILDFTGNRLWKGVIETLRIDPTGRDMTSEQSHVEISGVVLSSGLPEYDSIKQFCRSQCVNGWMYCYKTNAGNIREMVWNPEKSRWNHPRLADVYIDRESCSSAREMQSVRRWICPASGKYELVFSCAPENEAASCCAVLSINCGNVPEVIKQFSSSDTDNSFCGDVILSGNDAVDVSVTGNGAFRINVTVRKLRG